MGTPQGVMYFDRSLMHRDSVKPTTGRVHFARNMLFRNLFYIMPSTRPPMQILHVEQEAGQNVVATCGLKS